MTRTQYVQGAAQRPFTTNLAVYNHDDCEDLEKLRFEENTEKLRDRRFPQNSALSADCTCSEPPHKCIIPLEHPSLWRRVQARP